MTIGTKDLEQRVIHRHIMDTKDIRRGAKELDALQRKAHSSEMAALREISKASREKHKTAMAQFKEEQSAGAQRLASLKLAAVKILAVGAAWRTAQNALHAYLRNSQLAVSSGGAQIAKLEQAFGGLIETTETMQFASDAMSSSFGATQKEMETAAKFTRLLASRGKDLTKSFEAVKRAIVEGNAEGLKELGINIKTQSDTVEGFNAIIKEMRRQLALSGKEAAIAGEDIIKANVEMKNSWDELKTSFGGFVAELGPGVDLLSKSFKGLAFAISKPLDTLKSFGSFLSAGNLFGTEAFVDIVGYRKNLEAIERSVLSIRGSKKETLAAQKRIAADDKTFAAMGLKIQSMFRQLDRKDAAAKRVKKPSRGGGSGGFDTTGSDAAFDKLEDARLQKELDALVGGALTEGALGRGSRGSVLSAGVGFGGDTSGIGPIQGLGNARQISGFEAFSQDMDPKALKKFADVGIGAMNSLETAAQGAFRAMISGSTSAGEAFKKMAGNSALGMAAEMGVLALKELALAAASLALGPLGGVSAAGHAKAAAIAGGYAAVALGTAHALGVTGSNPAAGQSVGGGLGGGAGLQAGGRNERTIIFGDDLAGRSPRQRANEVNFALQLAEEEGDRGGAITFD